MAMRIIAASVAAFGPSPATPLCPRGRKARQRLFLSHVHADSARSLNPLGHDRRARAADRERASLGRGQSRGDQRQADWPTCWRISGLGLDLVTNWDRFEGPRLSDWLDRPSGDQLGQRFAVLIERRGEDFCRWVAIAGLIAADGYSEGKWDLAEVRAAWIDASAASVASRAPDCVSATSGPAGSTAAMGRITNRQYRP
jgi:hypothetical protein